MMAAVVEGDKTRITTTSCGINKIRIPCSLEVIPYLVNPLHMPLRVVLEFGKFFWNSTIIVIERMHVYVG